MDNLKIIWQTIKAHWPSHGQFLYYWVLGTVFIIPLLVINFGYNATVIRQLVLFVLVAIGWLLWVSQARRFGGLDWQRSAFNRSAVVLLAAVLITALVAPDQSQVWGLRGLLGESNPWGWLGVIFLAALIIQVVGKAKERMRQLAAAYLLSVSVLALFVLVWWGLYQELVIPAWTSFPAASLFFSVNAMVVAAWAGPLAGKSKVFWLAVLLLHLAVIFAYDYDGAWYLLSAGMLVLALAQLWLEPRLGAVDFYLPFVLIIIGLALLFAPVRFLSDKLGFAADNATSVGAAMSYPRFFKYNDLKTIAFGHGLGRGAEAFWQQAELVDMKEARQYPPLGWGFASLLWEGGVALLLAWLAALILILKAIGRYLKKSTSSNLFLILPAGLGLGGYLLVFLILPFDWFGWFGLGVFMAVAAAAVSAARPFKIGGRPGERSFMAFGAAAAATVLILLIVVGSGKISSRLHFFRSIRANGAAGAAVDLIKLDQVINGQLPIFSYRLARVDFIGQALNEAATASAEIKAEEIKFWLEILAKDYDWLAAAPISGAAAWQLASRAAGLAGQDQGAAEAWRNRAAANYQRAIETLPRNVILLTEAARFYRLNYSAPSPAAGDDYAGERQQYLSRAQGLVDRAIKIDDNYEAAHLERAELLLLAGQADEALESVKRVVAQNPAAAYNAGRLAFSTKKFDEAIAYYQQAISANPNHLQARYDLVQVHLALADFKAAALELEALAARAPADDAATQQLLQGLRDLLKGR